jgi:acyl carrier protein
MAESTTTVDKDDLRQIIADVMDIEEEKVTDDARFVEDLGVDSLMALEVTVHLEKKYHIKLAEPEMSEVTTLQKTYELLTSKLR